MSIGAIILLILLGIILLLIEFLIIPGISVAGIGGFLCLILGIVLAYYFQGARTGNYFLAGTLLLSVISIVFAFQSKTWRKFGLSSEIDAKNTPFETDKIQIGDTGKTVTRLAPVGKVQVGDVICEGKSQSGFIDENKEVEVTKILNTQIIVKLK